VFPGNVYFPHVCGTLESRNLISHVFLIICVAVQANPKKEEEDEAAASAADGSSKTAVQFQQRLNE
jgi:hypothetical protein